MHIILLFLSISPIFMCAQKTQSFDRVKALWTIENRKVVKYSIGGSRIAEFSNIEYGPPSIIDASDPFRILLFYSDLQMVVVLSSDANPIGSPFSFNQQITGTITGICRSRVGGFWAYSETNKRVFHFDNSFKQGLHSIKIPQEASGLKLTGMADSSDTLFLGFDNTRVVGLQLYGNKWVNFVINHSEWFSIEQGELWTVDDGTFERYSLKDSGLQISNQKSRCKLPPFIFNRDTLCFDRGRFFRVK